ncbi:MAG: hypothetical protein MUF67_14685, partial [Desulfobacterales bacterium]|nr:hypothetical protein [Desulfobacterales bacterium]
MQRLPVLLGAEAPLDHELELGTLGHGLGQLLQLLGLGRRHLAFAGFKGHGVEILGLPAQQRTQRAEGRGDDLGDQVDERLPDQVPHAE